MRFEQHERCLLDEWSSLWDWDRFLDLEAVALRDLWNYEQCASNVVQGS
ncbi:MULTISPECIES: hypothetical protein [unclassified Phormidesmis]